MTAPHHVTLGRIEIKKEAAGTLAAEGVPLDSLLRRHQSGDWGCVDDELERERLDRAADLGEMVSSHFVTWSVLDGKACSVFVTTEGAETRVVVCPPLR